jgi:hypothetical protein
MKNINIKVHTETVIGNIKKLNGGNLAPPISNVKTGYDVRKEFQELNMPLTRLHDAPLDNPGCRLIDIPCIFANFHADENDERNYYFKQSDDYIRCCIDECETAGYYQLGASIEHSEKKYFVAPPEDTGKWINIASNIIRHYTEGWANGFHYSILYWEIWNEPEGESTWGGPLDQFNQFYVEVATELKKRFPHLKFGGPAHGGYHRDTTTEFINYCAKHHTPLDFYSYHQYIHEPFGWIQKTPVIIRDELDAAGYTETEIHQNEWHYVPTLDTWRQMRATDEDLWETKVKIDEEMKGLDSAAFICAVMSGWQDVPVDMGCYYSCTGYLDWGIFQTGTNTRTKSYYGMKAFGEIVRYPKRLKTEKDSAGITALAGKDNKGNSAMLISIFKTGHVELVIEFSEKVNIEELKMLNDDQDLSGFYYYQFTDNKLSLDIKSNSAVLLVKFNKFQTTPTKVICQAQPDVRPT